MRDSWRHFVAEFIGTFALVFVGGAAIMIAKDTNSPAGLLGIAFAHGLILAVMVIPFTSSVAREVLKTVPGAQREAAYALGATRFEAIRAAMFFARTGIVGAVMLGFGRALGETMAVTMVIGNNAQVSLSLFQTSAFIRIRSTRPVKLSSAPIGSWTGTALAASFPCIEATHMSKSAPTLSILFMKATRGT